ncbi:hypothetical protein TWF506_002423 [Arthrobotrys conoides]|uniref:Protein kinase domain-containing protein n=1 Tax=Arthrobotrys conoides TaxID=74498 RepID=A0AAN8N932_9PEZI
MEREDDEKIQALKRTFTDQSWDVVGLANTLSTSRISQDILVLDGDTDEDDTGTNYSRDRVSAGDISRSVTTISTDYSHIDSKALSGLTNFYGRGTSFSTSASVENYSSSYDIIDFLAVAQHRRLQVLPFRWNPASEVGLGGTAKITQAATISVAYQDGTKSDIKYVAKRFQAEGAMYQDKDNAYQGLLSEAYILGHPVVRRHPNINSVEGIAFDVIFDEVWPVLIFKMTEHGDLRQFMKTVEGQKLSFDQRVELCWEIGHAISLMHSWYCIHGDLKPENILIFQDENKKFSAKVTDFGFSSIFVQDDETLKITLPHSWPWTAPEVEINPRVTFEQAKSADTFSYGLICVWLLCYDVLPAKESKGSGPEMTSFASLKQDLELIRRATDLVRIYVADNSSKSLAIVSLFDLTLGHDCNKRDLKTPLENLGLPFGFKRVNQSLHQEYGKSSVLITNARFELVNMLSQLRLCGEEIRTSVFERLEHRANTEVNMELMQKAAYDLALSYYIGFGTGVDKTKSAHWLEKSNKSQESLDDIVAMMLADTVSLYYAANEKTHYNAWVKSQTGSGSIPSSLIRATFGHEKSADNDEEELGLRGTGELIVYMESLRYQLFKMIGFIYDGPDIWKAPTWMNGLRGIQMDFHGKYKNKPLTIGEPLKITITPDNPKTIKDHIEAVQKSLETKSVILGLEHEDTLRELVTLCHLYTECKRWDDAEALLISTVCTQRDILGPDNPITLRSMERLAKLLVEKSCWKEAEELVFKIVDIRLAISRPQLEHNQYALEILMDLIRGYSSSGVEEAVEPIWGKLLQIFRAVAAGGEKIELVLLGMLQLAREYMSNQKHDRAEKILRELIAKAESFYGNGTAHVMEIKQLLAAAYLFQSAEKPYMFREAHRLLIEIRNFLSNTRTSNPSSTSGNFVHKVDIDGLRENTERLWSLVQENLDPSHSIDAVQRAEEALENLPEDSPDRTDYLATLGEALVARFNLLNDPDDLDAGLMWAEQALLILPEGHPKRARRLADLGSAIWHRYTITSSFSDLETSIQYAEESVLLAEGGDEGLAERLQVLVIRLEDRYEKTEDLDDLNKAIVFLEQLTYLTEPSDDKYAYWIDKLGTFYKRKWKFFNDLSDLDEAIKALERLEPIKDTLIRATLVSIFKDLANLYGDRSSILNTDHDLDKAIAKLEECLEIAQNTEPDDLERMGCGYGGIAADVALFYLIRFSRSNDIVDLTNAKERIEVAEALVPLESREREKVEGTKMIIMRVCDRVEKGGDWTQGVL